MTTICAIDVVYDIGHYKSMVQSRVEVGAFVACAAFDSDCTKLVGPNLMSLLTNGVEVETEVAGLGVEVELGALVANNRETDFGHDGFTFVLEGEHGNGAVVVELSFLKVLRKTRYKINILVGGPARRNANAADFGRTVDFDRGAVDALSGDAVIEVEDKVCSLAFGESISV